MRSTAKIFCVAKNETDLMESWIVYHASLVGFDNLVVIDNASSCEGVLGVYDMFGIDADEFITFPDFLDGKRDLLALRSKLHAYLLGLPKEATKLQIQAYFEAVPDPRSEFYVDQKIENPVHNITTFHGVWLVS